MSYLLFIDESGQDRKEAPYEVLGGLAVEDSRIWPLITAIHDAEVEFFGERISHGDLELKGKKLLKRKTFKLAAQEPSLAPEERTDLTRAALREGVAARKEGRESRHTRRQLTALGQAKLCFCSRVLEICAQHQARAFASLVDRDAPRPLGTMLRKDYAYLFERFYHFLAEQASHHHGIVVFDELERSQSHLLVSQMAQYFKETWTGRMRASRILPEPMFVHSDLSSLIQVADLIVYICSWGVTIKGVTRERRSELEGLASRVLALRFRTTVETEDGSFQRWSFVLIDDLRPAAEKAGGEMKKGNGR